MVLKFKCEICDGNIVVRSPKIGDQIQCEKCGTISILPNDAANIPQPPPLPVTKEEQNQERENDGFFAPEKRGIENGIVGGLTMMAIAVIWFVLGYQAGYIFYYPPILFLIGVYGFLKGCITGNVCGASQEG